MPRRGASLLGGSSDQQLLGGGTITTGIGRGRETAPYATRDDRLADEAIRARTVEALEKAQAGDNVPVIVLEPIQSSIETSATPGASTGEGVGPGGGIGSEGATGADESAGGEAPGFEHGGLVEDFSPREGGKEPVTAHEGEYIINASAVKKYGLQIMDMINRGVMKVRRA